ncbi:MAG: hypothetical protein LBH69_01335 [Methanomassiliicoccaceae archaeon]|jgi:hypothetical protein|nr:hypothetical protein [Methanomassiliicoccaceae archaeon]
MRVAIRRDEFVPEGEAYPETKWHYWCTPETLAPFGYRIASAPDVDGIAFDDFDVMGGTFVFNQSKYDARRYAAKDAERSLERAELYVEADKMIAKHIDYVELDLDQDGAHALTVSEWRTYKVSVRETTQQVGYPEDVTYQDRPDAAGAGRRWEHLSVPASRRQA